MKGYGWIWPAGLLAIAACEDTFSEFDPPRVSADEELRQELQGWGARPIEAVEQQDDGKVALGQALFFDKILSGNRDISCATCHDPDAFLSDGLSLPVGTGGTGRLSARTLGTGRSFVSRQAPSLLNVAPELFYVFADGRLRQVGPQSFELASAGIVLPGVDILAAQALLPVLDRIEMRGDAGDIDALGESNELAEFADDQSTEIWRALMERLLAIPEYVTLFEAAFPGRPIGLLRFLDAAEAISAFEKEAFASANSPFDRFLRGDLDALSPAAKRGARLFSGEGACITCHSGPLLGGESFANVGAPQVGPGFGRARPLDLGRGEHDDNDSYRFAFRVGRLRNIELTAPYMHSGAYPTLEAVVKHYSDVPRAMREYDVSQLPPALRASYHGDPVTIAAIDSTLDHRFRTRRRFTDEEQRDLVTFLKSLTDPDARDLRWIVPDRVPSGLSVR